MFRSSIPPGNPSGSPPASSRHCVVRLTDIFPRQCMEFIGPCNDMSAVIHQLIQTLTNQQRLCSDHAGPIVTEFLERERLLASALGHGLAFPHIRSRMVDQFIGAIGVAQNGINLASRDGKPTKLVILTISPWEQRDLHLGVLSRLVSLMQDKAIQLRMESTLSPSDVWQHIKDLDDRSENGDHDRGFDGEEQQ